MTKEEQIARLAVKHLTDTLDEQEQQELSQWLDASPENRQLFEQYTSPEFIGPEYRNRQQRKERIEARISEISAGAASGDQKSSEDAAGSSAAPVHRVHFLRTSWFRYAAAILLLVGGVVWYKMLNQVQHDGKVRSDGGNVADVQPGSNKAVLTVGNKKIDLASDKTGITVGSAITYTDGGEILNLVQNDGSGGARYDGGGGVQGDGGGGVRQMELKTPRGGQYRALLPDGSRVWLNAASSIRFPSKFTGSNREVQINGEAYLEIAKNTKQPFVVKTNKATVEVLGTSFNVNSYEDEETERTTLIEGSIKVNNNKTAVVLQPGQQAEIRSSQEDKIKTIDDQAEAATAWKHGIFNFNNADIKTMMRQIARWYNVEIDYQGTPPTRTFKGEMQRDIPLSSALRILELSKIHFRLEGRKLIVLP